MKRFASFAVSICFALQATAQLLYTSPLYTIRKDSAVKYGVSPNYCGRPDTLKMNIYKPIGDNNRFRPVVVFVHGGGFVSPEDFNEYHMNTLAKEFAKRGYVAASIDYREGMHLYNYGTGLPGSINILTPDWSAIAGAFVTDSGEVVRALYRAQQDVKAAIRFMKQRSLTDSSSTCKFFIAGHSAGAITVTAAAFTDLASEKSPLAQLNSTVANPAWRNRCEFANPFNPAECWVVQANGPAGRDNYAYRLQNPAPFDYENAGCYNRPDLGPIDGTENMASGFSTKIMGAAALAGAIVDTNIFAGPNKPAFYMYHTNNDVVVPVNSNYPFTFWANFLSPAPHVKWPVMYGSNWMKNKLTRLAYQAPFKFDLYDNSADILLSQTHDLLPNDFVVADSVARFFARVMDTSTACFTVLALAFDFNLQLRQNMPTLNWDANCNTTILYVVERSLNGQDFAAIDTVACSSNAAGKLQYQDGKAPSGTPLFYRIKLVQQNGNMMYSTIKSLTTIAMAGGLNIYPNPAKNYFWLLLPDGRIYEKYDLAIFDITGRQVHQQSFYPSQQRFDFSIKSSGTYRVVVTAPHSPTRTASVHIVQ